MPERDPLESLREAWSRLDAPPATPEKGDEQTEAAIAWMRDAWTALEAPQVRVPLQLQHTKWRARLREARPMLVAAAILILFALALRPWRATKESARPEEMARVGENVPIGLISPANPADPIAPVRPTRRVIADAPEQGVVMESGNVRLILLQPIEEHPSTEPNSNHEPDTGFDNSKENTR